MARAPTRQQKESAWRAAVRGRNFEAMEWILGQGWDVNHTTRQGMTALMDAAQMGATDVFLFLLDRGATPDRPQDYLRLAIDRTYQSTLIDTLRAMPWHTRTADVNGLCQALIRGEEAIAQKLLSADVVNRPHYPFNSDRVDPKYCAPLACAAQHCPSMLGPLLDMGADPNFIPDTSMPGRTVFAQICAHARASMRTMTSLIDAGADINVKDALGEAPITIAARSGNLPLMQLLRNRGADIHTQNHLGENALAIAQNAGRVEATALLNQWGADDQADDISKHTGPARGSSSILRF